MLLQTNPPGKDLDFQGNTFVRFGKEHRGQSRSKLHDFFLGGGGGRGREGCEGKMSKTQNDHLHPCFEDNC